MKKCPYCAEPIQDEAIKCRYCGSDLTVPPPSPTETPASDSSAPAGPEATRPQWGWATAPGAPAEAHEASRLPGPVQGSGSTAPAEPRVGEGAARFSHSGYRYILGFGADFFGIWDRESPGPPVMRFPRTDQGWVEAWNRFSVLEPRAMAVEGTAGPAPGGVSAQLRPTGGLARWLSALLIVLIPLTLLEMAFVAQRILLLVRFRSGPGDVSAAQGSAADTRVLAVARIVGLIGLAVVVLWLIWQYRSHKNLRPFALSGLRYSPGWVVGYWLIPFTFPVWPYLTMRELWQASDPNSGAVDWKMTRTTPLLPLWWLTFLSPIVLNVIAAGVTTNDATAGAAITSDWLTLAALGLNAVAAALAAVLVRRIQARMEAKRARLASWAASPAPAR